MYKLLILAFSFFLFSYHSKAELFIEPLNPEIASNIKFTYHSKESNSKIFAFILEYNHNLSNPIANEIELFSNGKGEFSAIYKADSSVVFSLVKIAIVNTSKRILDNNESKFWEVKFKRNGIDTYNSNLVQGLTFMGSNPSSFDRIVDMNLAQKAFENELKLYPNNQLARIAQISLLFDTKRINSSEYEKRLKEVLDQVSEVTNENLAKALIRAYRTLNMNSKADEIENIFIKRNPSSKLAEEKLMSQLSEANSLKEFDLLAKEIFSRIQNSNNRDNIFQAYTSAYLQSGKLDELANNLKTIADVPANVYALIASEVSNNPKILKDASKEERYKKAIEYFQIALSSAKNTNSIVAKPNYLTKSEWYWSNRLLLASIQEIGATFSLESNELQNADLMFAESIENYADEVQEATLVKFVSVLSKLNKNAEIVQLIEQKLPLIDNSTTLDSLYKVYSKENIESLNKKLNELKAKSKSNRIAKLKENLLRFSITNSSLKSLDGRYEEISDYKGKVSSLFFMSTWCGPCQALFPVYNKIYKDNKNNTNLAIMAINLWEKEADKVAILDEFLEKMPAEFPIFIDETDLLAKKIGVIGLPTIVFLDKKGDVRYIYKGFTNDVELINLSQDLFEILQNE